MALRNKWRALPKTKKNMCKVGIKHCSGSCVFYEYLQSFTFVSEDP